MPIVSAEPIDKGTQANGDIKLQIRLIDNIGKVYIIPTRILPPGFDIPAELVLRTERKNKELIIGEVNEYIEAIIAGKNPFRNADDSARDPQYQNRNEALVKVLKKLLSAPKSQIVRYLPGLKFLDKVTDNQFKVLLGISDAKVAAIRTRQAEMLTVHESLDAYAPEIGED